MNDERLTMNNFPDFSEQGYQVERTLGHNRSGGRVTYLATSIETQLSVVIKQFQFAQVGTSWSDYEAHEREIELLQQLNSPSIPQYLDAFETATGFCLVQEYKNAPSLAQLKYFRPQEVKEIAVAVLEVLVYLQQQVPTIIHRDIKPENLLVERSQPLKVYLVDFGLARHESQEVAVSSVVKGTLGFMPPEQLFNRQLTTASDLYGLGATLICLLTQTKSAEIGNLIDETYRINFQSLVPQLSPQFVDWLSKMVAPSLKDRFENASVALEALQSTTVINSAETLQPTEGTTQLTPHKHKLLVLKLGLAAVLGTSWSISYSMVNPVDIENPIHALAELQETGQCLGCNLSGIDLRGFDLTGVDLTGANLSGADLRSAYLKSANLTDANLTAADLRGAYLESANLIDAELEGAKLESADLRYAIMPDGIIHP